MEAPKTATGLFPSLTTWETSQWTPHFWRSGRFPAPSWGTTQARFSSPRLGCFTGGSVRNLTFRAGRPGTAAGAEPSAPYSPTEDDATPVRRVSGTHRAPVLNGTADLCLGARLPEPGAWPWHARFANRVLAFELRRRTGVNLTDLGPMRAARREALLGLELHDRGSGWPLEMVLRAAAEGWRIAEAGVTYRPRSGGRSKVSGSVRGTARAVRDMSAQLSPGRRSLG